jgi:hypothetical protein
MPIPVLIPPALRLILSTAIGAKIVGFVFSWVTSPTNHAMRTAFLDHVGHVIEGLDKAGIGIGPSDRVSLIEDLAVLRDSAEVGWTEPHETSALGRTFWFLSWAHTKGVGEGVGSAAASHAKAVGDWIWKKGGQALDTLFPRLK